MKHLPNISAVLSEDSNLDSLHWAYMDKDHIFATNKKVLICLKTSTFFSKEFIKKIKDETILLSRQLLKSLQIIALTKADIVIKDRIMHLRYGKSKDVGCKFYLLKDMDFKLPPPDFHAVIDLAINKEPIPLTNIAFNANLISLAQEALGAEEIECHFIGKYEGIKVFANCDKAKEGGIALVAPCIPYSG
jgi:hypothetical protein